MFSVVLIVRDEAQSLPAALASLGAVPDLVVCDTGSVDDTPALAKSLGARVVSFAWCDDFAAARSFAESHARFDWIFRLDADERFETEVPTRASLSEWLNPHLDAAERIGAGQVFMRRCHSGNDEHWFPRIHRRSLLIWKYPVHERVIPRDGAWPRSIAADGARVRHERRERPRPYRRILERALAEAPADPYLVFHLGRECFLTGNILAATLWLKTFLSGEPGYRFHRSEAEMLLGRCLASTGDMAGAFSALEQAAQQGPRAEPLWHAAQLALRCRDFDRAQRYYQSGHTMTPPLEKQPFGQLAPPYVTDWNCYGTLAWSGIKETLDQQLVIRKSPQLQPT